MYEDNKNHVNTDDCMALKFNENAHLPVSWQCRKYNSIKYRLYSIIISISRKNSNLKSKISFLHLWSKIYIIITCWPST